MWLAVWLCFLRWGSRQVGTKNGRPPEQEKKKFLGSEEATSGPSQNFPLSLLAHLNFFFPLSIQPKTPPSHPVFILSFPPGQRHLEISVLPTLISSRHHPARAPAHSVPIAPTSAPDHLPTVHLRVLVARVCPSSHRRQTHLKDLTASKSPLTCK